MIYEETPSFSLSCPSTDTQRLAIHKTLLDSFSQPTIVANPLLQDQWLPWARRCTYAGDHDYAPLAIPGPTLGEIRHSAVKSYSWAIPSHAALETCVWACGKSGKVLELGSGTGYWASLLSSYGLDVVAVDNGSETHRDEIFSPHFSDAIKDDAEMYLIQNDGARDRALFLCWPRDASRWVDLYRGKTVIWIGEEDGCTWEMDRTDGWEVVRTIRIPSWGLIHDKLVVYKRAAA